MKRKIKFRDLGKLQENLTNGSNKSILETTYFVCGSSLLIPAAHEANNLVALLTAITGSLLSNYGFCLNLLERTQRFEHREIKVLSAAVLTLLTVQATGMAAAHIYHHAIRPAFQEIYAPERPHDLTLNAPARRALTTGL